MLQRIQEESRSSESKDVSPEKKTDRDRKDCQYRQSD